MVRVTVFLLLALVSSVMLTQTMATRNESAVYDDLSTSAAVPTCQADYAKMDIKQPKLLVNYPGLGNAHGVCTNPKNGDFVVAYWQPRTFVYLFDSCGWIKRRMNLPKAMRHSASCAFSNHKLYYAATIDKQILQFNQHGTFEKVFASGFGFLFLTVRGSNLYSSIIHTRSIRVYNTANGNNINHFEVTSGTAHGLAFDPHGYLYVTKWSKVVEIFTSNGHKVHEVTYPGLTKAEGILIDSANYVIIVDRGGRQVLVYNYNNLLVNKIVGFRLPIDVAMGYKCGYVLVTDLGRGTFLL